jgi:hypothetical protein
MMRQSRLVPDLTYPGVWWVQRTNLTRANAAPCFTETERRCQRARRSLSEGRRCVKTRRQGKTVTLLR